MKNVMAKAWEIARKGQKNFGGKVKEYIAQALRMAWALNKKGGVEMKGSEKQIAWAEDIKKHMHRQMDSLQTNLLNDHKDDKTRKFIVRSIELIKEAIDEVEYAKTFINAKQVTKVAEQEKALKIIHENLFDVQKLREQAAQETNCQEAL